MVSLVSLGADSVEVDGYAEGSADLVLTAVTLADGTGFIVIAHEVLAKLLIQLHSGAGENLLLGKRQDSALEGSQSGMQAQNGADIVIALLVLTHNFLIVSIAEDGQNGTLNTQGGLNDIGNIVLVGFLIVVGQILAGDILVLGQVIVGTVSNAPQLTPTEGEEELKVSGGLGVEAQLLGIMVTQTQVLVLQTDVQQEVVAESTPVVEPLKVSAGLAEELELHLLKLSYTEDEVAGSDLVAEALADLSDTEGHLAAGGALDIDKVGENALSGLGTEVNSVLSVLGDTLEGLEHQVKLTDIGEVVLAAGGAGDIVLLYELLHLGMTVGIDGLGQLKAVLFAPVLNDLVCTETLVALTAVHERIGEAAEVTGCDPGLGVHQYSSVKTNIVGVLLDELLPPGLFNVVLQLNAKGAVVPGVGKAAVNLAACEDEAAVFAQGNDFVHCFFGVFHFALPFLRLAAAELIFWIVQYSTFVPVSQYFEAECKNKTADNNTCCFVMEFIWMVRSSYQWHKARGKCRFR